ncbi:MAG: ureidoglycolate lyase [Dongiaceae bacterium]
MQSAHPQQAVGPNLKPEAASMPDLPLHQVPLVLATPESLKGYGEIIAHPDARKIDIVRWPAKGWRQIDAGTGDQGGTTEGEFEFHWQGDVLKGRNHAVDDDYVLGWSRQPSETDERQATAPRDHVLIWRANYHPDGGQLFFPLDGGPFVATLALPGDDVTPDSFTAFWFDGGVGLYIYPEIWHDALSPVDDDARFFGRQGKVHARVQVFFPQEFGCYLATPLRKELARASR